MGKLTPMTTRMVNAGMELYMITREHLASDGVICERDEAVLIGIRRLTAQSEMLDRARRAARTIEDACEITPHATRLIAEGERDIAPILALSPNYPRKSPETANIA